MCVFLDNSYRVVVEISTIPQINLGVMHGIRLQRINTALSMEATLPHDSYRVVLMSYFGSVNCVIFKSLVTDQRQHKTI